MAVDLVAIAEAVYGLAEPGYKPKKIDIINSLIRAIKDELARIEASIAGDSITKAAWADLNAQAGTRAGQRGEVRGDAGTHTDPVVGGTKANSGLYTWSTAPAGWRWIADALTISSDQLAHLADLMGVVGSSDDPSGFTHAFTDQLGAVIAALTASGQFVANGYRLGDAGELTLADQPSEFVFIIPGANGEIIFGVRPDGTTAPAFAGDAGAVATPAVLSRDVSLPYDVLQIPLYGQSLARGQGGKPVKTTSQKHNAIMFSGGVRADDGGPDPAVIYADYLPMVSGINPSNTSLGETPVPGMAEMVMQLLASENGVSHAGLGYQILGCCPGEGGKKLSELAQGSDYYDRLIENVQYGATRSAAKLKTHAVGMLPFVHGQADTTSLTSPTAYKAGVIGLRNDFQDDIAAFLPANPIVPMPISQTSSYKFYGVPDPAIALAQYQLPDEDPNIALVVPDYIFASSGVHMTATGYKHMGAYFGLWFKRVVVDGDYWRDMRVKSFTVQGRVLTVEFNADVAPIVFDTSIVSDPGNYGFNLVGPTGTPIAFSTPPAIVSPTRVRFIAPADIVSGSRLRYGWNGTAVDGPTTGPRGCLRDSRGDRIVLDPGGLKLPLHAWAPIFELTLAA